MTKITICICFILSIALLLSACNQSSADKTGNPQPAASQAAENNANQSSESTSSPTSTSEAEPASSSEQPTETADMDSIIPAGWQLYDEAHGPLAKAEGDLNKDGIDDTAVIIEKSDFEEGVASSRSLLIAFGMADHAYDLSIVSEHTILSADEGGVWGDPFESIAIDRGSVVISHYGGSNWRWYSRYRFRYQDGDWYLIGATTGEYNTGATNIENADEEDYNLLTGDYSIRRGEDGKTTAETGKREINPLIKLDQFDIRSADPAGTGR